MGNATQRASSPRFAFFAWCVLAYNVLVILWGAVVRATGSGAGCGEHWPLCQGVVIPHAAQLATLIEFAHRATSGVAVLLVVVLIFLAFRGFPARHPVRRYAALALFFTLTEGLLGAALVLFGWVGNNASTARVLALSVHLVNTFLLLASFALTAWFATNDAARKRTPLKPVPQAPGPAAGLPFYLIGLAGVLAVAVTGTIAALGDTLYRVNSLAQGLQLDFSATAKPLLRLRMIHPAIAALVGIFLIYLAVRTVTSAARSASNLAYALLALVVLQLGLGLLNLLLLTPVWMQILHLLAADLIWIALVLLAAEAFSRSAVQAEALDGGMPGRPEVAEAETLAASRQS